MAQLSNAQFRALYGSSGTTFPDNTTGDISEADMRQFGQDISDSFFNLIDSVLTFPNSDFDVTLFPWENFSGSNRSSNESFVWNNGQAVANATATGSNSGAESSKYFAIGRSGGWPAGDYIVSIRAKNNSSYGGSGGDTLNIGVWTMVDSSTQTTVPTTGGTTLPRDNTFYTNTLSFTLSAPANYLAFTLTRGGGGGTFDINAAIEYIHLDSYTSEQGTFTAGAFIILDGTEINVGGYVVDQTVFMTLQDSSDETREAYLMWSNTETTIRIGAHGEYGFIDENSYAEFLHLYSRLVWDLGNGEVVQKIEAGQNGIILEYNGPVVNSLQINDSVIEALFTDSSYSFSNTGAALTAINGANVSSITMDTDITFASDGDIIFSDFPSKILSTNASGILTGIDLAAFGIQQTIINDNIIDEIGHSIDVTALDVEASANVIFDIKGIGTDYNAGFYILDDFTGQNHSVAMILGNSELSGPNTAVWALPSTLLLQCFDDAHGGGVYIQPTEIEILPGGAPGITKIHYPEKMTGPSPGEILSSGEVSSAVTAGIRAIAWKAPVRVASTANVNISNAGTTIDGVTIGIGNRVLLKDQTAPNENGIYRVATTSPNVLTRDLDFANATSQPPYCLIPIYEGSTHAGKTFKTTNTGPIVVGTDDITIAQAF